MSPVDPHLIELTPELTSELTSRQRQAVCALYELGAVPGGREESVTGLKINDLGRLYFFSDSYYSQALTRLRALGLVAGQVRSRLGRRVHCWQLTAAGTELAQQLIGVA